MARWSRTSGATERPSYERAIDAGSTLVSRVIVTLAFKVALATPR
jgi:hypothetical protein